MSIIKPSSIAFTSFHKLAIAFLWLVLVILGTTLSPAYLRDTSAYGADNQADCVALGGSWEAPNASNYGKGGCSGQGPCEASGGIWTASSRVCTTVGKTYLNDSMDNKVKAFNYYAALAVNQCNFGGSITGEDIGNYVWLLGSNPHLAQGSRGSLDCNQRDGKDGKWLRDAMNLFNIPGDTAGEKLCALGMTQTSVSNESLRASCGANAASGPDKFEWKGVDSKRSAVLSTIRKWYFNNQEPTFTDAMTYHVAIQDFLGSQLCSATITPQADYSNNTSTSKTFSIYTVEGNSVPTTPKSYTVSGDNQYKYSELYGFSAVGGSRYVVGNVACADYQAGANINGDLPTVGGILSQKKYADAYLLYISNNATDDTLLTDPGDIITPADDANTTTCAIEGIGWIVCPVLNFLGNVTDSVYQLVSGWLEVDPALYKEGTGTYNGWSAMRNIANVGFVIIFLIVIFSQITGAGISNYGIKKLFPKLIVVAILINISFFVAQIAVDLSNILGSSLKSFLGDTAVFSSTPKTFSVSGNSFSSFIVQMMAGGLTFAGVAVAATGAFFYGGIGLLVMILVSALLAVLVVFLILSARIALIVILIVVMPLALLAMVLPNTKSWFDKWRKMFVALLVIYPMVAILFGGAELAANIIGQNAGADMMQILLALGVATIPLFAVIPMLKGSLNAIPIVGNMASKLANRASLSGAVKNRSKQARGNFANNIRAKALGGEGGGRTRRAARWLAGGQARNKTRNDRYDSEIGRAQAIYTANEALAPGSKASQTERAAAVSALRKVEEEEITAAQTQQASMTFNARKAIATGQAPATEVQRTAAIRYLMDTGNFKDRKELVEMSATMSEKQRQAVSQGVMAKGDQKVYGASIGDSILEGKTTADSLARSTAETIVAGKVGSTTLARDAGSAEYIESIARENRHGLLQVKHKQTLNEEAQKALTNPELDIPPELAHHIDNIKRL